MNKYIIKEYKGNNYRYSVVDDPINAIRAHYENSDENEWLNGEELEEAAERVRREGYDAHPNLTVKVVESGIIYCDGYSAEVLEGYDEAIKHYSDNYDDEEDIADFKEKLKEFTEYNNYYWVV